MRNQLFQLYDLKADAALGPIMVMKHEGPAIREFHAVLNMPESQPGRYPEDFVLLKIGEQNEETGELEFYAQCEHCKQSARHTEPKCVVATGNAWKLQKSDSEQTSLKLTT